MKETDNSRRARRGSGAITLRDVAKLAGVAPITASRVLNTPEQVSAEVRQKVLDAVQRTGYVPNRMAGGLASSRSRLIAAVVPSTVMSVFMPTIEALNDTLFDAGYQLMLGQSGYSAAREESLLEAIIGRRPDGIFLTGILRPGLGRTRLMASGIPVVETWDLTPTPIDMLVGFSHADIGREVARAGLAPVSVVNVGASRSLQSGREGLDRLLAQAPDVDAVFCSSDLLALGVLTEARVRGIAVAERMAIMGFGDVPFAADMAPALSTVHINGVEIGRLAARSLIDRAEGREVAQRVVDVGFSIVERETS
ncbi:GntR family transcriptional regulator [Hydrogenophaga sp. Root209]|uniref:LacI family DNA-binding transcriptional regulator n=1 Tax=Hydrogenophaga sp. Root209 TaxID=1736490 RepID=UPI0006FD7960|nr:LacI family DNA-binding transcriptional regulator [Hydrogenophaga sp. Root209]KRB97678.1 GntR family transcriptional regulator [Hydrogenophaga sp. Root209]